MPVSGLVIVLAGSGDRTKDTCDLLRARGPFTVGEEVSPGRVPVVLETATPREHREQLDWLEGLPGVAMVEVAYAHYSNTEVPNGS